MPIIGGICPPCKILGGTPPPSAPPSYAYDVAQHTQIMAELHWYCMMCISRFQWTQLGGHTCSGTVTVCGFDQGTQENWLITQHISRELAGGQRLRKVTVQFNITFNGCDTSRQCRQTFDVFKWQTSSINETTARNTNNYEKVDRVSPQGSDGFGSSIESLDIDLDAESGFYLGVVDLSTCITINRILVFYYACPAETSQLITRPEAIQALSMDDNDVTVTGECVENSSTEKGISPLVGCNEEGQWNVIIPCLCNPGYESSDTQGECLGIIYTCMYVHVYRVLCF